MPDFRNPDRLDAVDRSGLIERSGDDFDRFTRLAAAIVDAPIVLLSIVTDERQHFVANSGFEAPAAFASSQAHPSTPVSESYCRIVVDTEVPLVVSDSSNDDRVMDHPANVSLGVRAYAGVPVRDDDGFVLGSFCAIDHTAREWTERDLGLLADLAASVESELSLRATRDKYQKQVEVERREREFEQSLLAVATETNRVAGIEATAAALVRKGALVVDASFISLALLDEGAVTFYHGPNLDDSVAEDWPSAPLGTPVPMVVAIETGEAVRIDHPGDFEAWPAMASDVEKLGIASFLALPITDEMSDLVGVIAMGWMEERPSGPIDPRCLRLATLTTQALVGAHRFDQARAQARVLEQVVLPSLLPSPDGIDVAGSYLAPSSDQRVGGDVYDAVVRPDGTVGVVIADAVGHDLEAARSAARVRHAIGVLLTEGRMPAEVLDSVNTYVCRSTQIRHVTCACAVVDQTAGTATIAIAGHPQPRVLFDGTLRLVGPVGDPLFGVAPHTYSDEVVEFPPGSRLVAFTDGLVERRDASIVEGEAWLDSTLPTIRSASVDDFVGDLMARVETLERSDDIALIVVENSSGEAGARGRHFRSSAARDSIDLATVRAGVTSWLDEVGSAHLAEPVLLVTTELLTNARTATTGDEPVTLEVTADGSSVAVSVSNAGADFNTLIDMPGVDSTRGRGLAIVRAIASDVSTSSESGRVTVRAEITDR